MTDLTESQKKSVDLLIKQYDVMNQATENETFDLVDINLINTDIKVVEQMKDELRAHNKKMLEAHTLHMEKLVERLNKDFKKGKLPIKAELAKLSQAEIDIVNVPQFRSSDIYGFRFRMRVTTRSTEIKHKEHNCGYRVNGFEYGIETSGSEKKWFSTPEKFFADDIIKMKLIKLVQYITTHEWSS